MDTYTCLCMLHIYQSEKCFIFLCNIMYQLSSLFSIKQIKKANFVLCSIYQLSLQSTPFSVHSVHVMGTCKHTECTSQCMFKVSSILLNTCLTAKVNWAPKVTNCEGRFLMSAPDTSTWLCYHNPKLPWHRLFLPSTPTNKNMGRGEIRLRNCEAQVIGPPWPIHLFGSCCQAKCTPNVQNGEGQSCSNHRLLHTCRSTSFHKSGNVSSGKLV
jgi:hypothetical protein